MRIKLKRAIFVSLGIAAFALTVSGIPFARAGVGVGVAPDFPATVSVGEQDVAVGLEITNNSTPDVGSINLSNIRLIPSCGDSDADSTTCAGVETDPDVFIASATGTGADACAGINFTIAENDAVTGQLLFTPDATVTLAQGATCRIDFTVDVNQAPADDSSGADGLQTLQIGRVTGTQTTGGTLAGTGLGTDETTVSESRIIVVKQTVPDGSEQEFAFEASYDLDGFTLGDGDQNDSGPLASGSYSVSETLPDGWSQTSATCDDGSNPASISLGIDETVTCTFTNTQGGTVIIVKDSVPDSDQDFTFTNDFGGDHPATFDLDDDAEGTLSSSRSFSVSPGTFSVSEGEVGGWVNTSATCDDQSPVDAIEVSAGETVTCTFVNTQSGMIIVDKVTNPSGATQSFSFDAVGEGYDDFSLTDTASANAQALDPGSYSVSETVPDGWEQTDAACVSSIEDTETPGALELDAGETITCTFTNSQDGRIIVEKQTEPDGSSVSFSFTANYDNDGFSLMDDEQNDSGTLASGTYSVSENAVEGWELVSATCSDESPISAIVLSAGEVVTCIFTNRDVEGSISGMKFNDLNGNGVRDEGEPALSGWTINLDGPGDNDDSMVTDGSGNYSFTGLASGTYIVTEVQQTGWMQTAPASPGNFTIELSDGEDSTGNDFGNQEIIVADGCSPGYWKQPHHFGSYPDDIFPNTEFQTVFGTDAFEGMTLLEVLSQGGGGINALGRIIVAAYLNAATIEGYPHTPEEVVADFQDALEDGNFEEVKDHYEDLQGECPLGRNPGPAGPEEDAAILSPGNSGNSNGRGNRN